jgi:N-glycosylase/DNA lyase
MIRIKNKNFSLAQIADSGQCFRMEKGADEENVYTLVAFGKYLKVHQVGDEIVFDCDEEEYHQIWKAYFDLETDYDKLAKSVDEADSYLRNAMKFGKGIRILKQDLWEMIITFIVSQQNNIKRIKRIINSLCERYGKELVADDGTKYYSFPTPKELSKATLEDLLACNLGYRAKYILKTTEMILHKEIDLDRVATMEYEEARKELLKLVGIGGKVADCVCLFSIHMLEAFPVDTHIQQVFDAQYPNGFPFDRYEGYAGVIQQYIFYYDLKGKKEEIEHEI